MVAFMSANIIEKTPNPKNHTNFLDCNPKIIYVFLD